MTYREKLKKLRDGTLDEGQKEELEQEIERHEAISEFLFDQEIPELDDILEAGLSETEGSGDRAFVEVINRSIRKAFRKMGCIVLAVGLALGILLQTGVPRLVSLFYYDPGKKVGECSNQISLDMKVYSELFLPCRQKETVTVDANGYGDYDICIKQNFSFNRTFTDVSGKITRNKLKLYNTNPLKLPTGNCFVWFQAETDRPLDEQDERYNVCAAGKLEDSIVSLNELNGEELYIGYVSLNEMMEYEEFVQYVEQNEMDVMWCAAKTYEPGSGVYNADNIGFNFDLTSSSSLEWDGEKYPDLVLWNILSEDGMGAEEFDQLEQNMKSEPFMRRHFVSMLNYLADQKEFLGMVETNNLDAESLHDAAKYVEENGITIYGYASVLSKEDALALMELDHIYEIYMTPLQ